MMKEHLHSITIPREILKDENLKSNEKILYGEIVTYISIYGSCFLTNKELSEMFGVTKQSVSGWVSNLEKHGYITNQYYLIKDQWNVREISINEKVVM